MKSIKQQLADYLELVESNDREIARYEALEANNTVDEILAVVKENIIKSTNDEIEQKKQIEKAIASIPSTAQKQLMTYRYIDKLPWRVITKILFCSQSDYNNNPDKYKRKTFRLHTRAIEYLERTKSMQ